MLKITKLPGREGVLKLEGKLLAPWIDELLRACEPSLIAAPLMLDLSGVLFADAAGMRALRTLMRQGVAIAHCPPLLTEMLKEKSP
jgi:hypothetical protein